MQSKFKPHNVSYTAIPTQLSRSQTIRSILHGEVLTAQATVAGGGHGDGEGFRHKTHTSEDMSGIKTPLQRQPPPKAQK